MKEALALLDHAEREADQLSHLIHGLSALAIAYELRKTLSELRVLLRGLDGNTAAIGSPKEGTPEDEA